jgi:drug/metabolite transporter (DMT)-like permease
VLGGFLALLSAATFAWNNASVRRGVLSGSVLQAMAITVPIGVPLFFVAALATGDLGAVAGFSPTALAALAAAGIMHFVWGRYCNYRAIRAIGTNLAAPVQQVNLVFSLVLAIWVLGEQLTVLRLLGIALILIGPGFTLREGEDKPPPAQAEDARAGANSGTLAAAESGDLSRVRANDDARAFKPAHAEGYLFAVLSATGYGLSPILIRIALQDRSLGASLAGGFISYAAATAVMALILLWPGQLRHVFAVNRESAKWFTFSGVLVCVSQMFLYMAIAVAPVTVVVPINRLTIVFRLYFSRWLNPRHEVFGGRVIVGTVVSFMGAVVLSLSTETLSAMLPLPEAVMSVLRWHWP